MTVRYDPDVPRNAVAVWLKAVFMIASTPPLFGWAPLPGVLQSVSTWHARSVLILIIAGCFISLIGIFWPDRLDGGAIEQLGLVILTIGIGLFVSAILVVVPRNWFSSVVYAGLAIAFVIQFWSIRRFRKSLAIDHG